MQILIAIIFVFVVNIPFGYWREGTRKFSLYWFIAIHAPVPLIVMMRSYLELGYVWYTYAILIPTFFIGQRAGAYLRQKNQQRTEVEKESIHGK